MNQNLLSILDPCPAGYDVALFADLYEVPQSRVLHDALAADETMPLSRLLMSRFFVYFSFFNSVLEREEKDRRRRIGTVPM